MKKIFLGIGVALMAPAMLVSCGNSDDSNAKKAEQPQAVVSPLPEGAIPTYRFINMDSLFLKYNLSIDFTEQMLRLSNDFETEYKKKMTHLTNKGKSLEQQYDNIQSQRVQLPSEVEAFQKDYENFQSQSGKVQQELYEKQMQLEQMQAKNMQTVMDSVQNFLREFAPSKGYTAIFYGSQVAGYYHPSLDVTNEVVEGLNARYNKVNK